MTITFSIMVHSRMKHRDSVPKRAVRGVSDEWKCLASGSNRSNSADFNAEIYMNFSRSIIEFGR